LKKKNGYGKGVKRGENMKIISAKKVEPSYGSLGLFLNEKA